MTKKKSQKFKYFENEKSFKDEIENIFHHFQIILEGENPILRAVVSNSCSLQQVPSYSI